MCKPEENTMNRSKRKFKVKRPSRIGVFLRYFLVGVGVMALIPFLLLSAISVLLGYGAYKIIDKFIDKTDDPIQYYRHSYMFI